MTALMSAFIRWYHHENGFPVIFSDDMAGEILTEKEKGNSRKSGTGDRIF